MKVECVGRHARFDLARCDYREIHRLYLWQEHAADISLVYKPGTAVILISAGTMKGDIPSSDILLFQPEGNILLRYLDGDD